MMESNEMVLPRLLSLKLSNLPEHVSLVSGAPQIICRSLKNMTIEACPNLTVNFGDPSVPIQEQDPSKPNSIEVTHPHFLENLNLHGLSQLKKISKDRLAGFMHLTSLQLNECENLEYVFSLGIAKGLSSLQELKVISCEKVEKIITRETDEVATENAVEFPQVNTLVLEKLPKFTGFFSQDGCSVKWLSLKKVKVVECPKIRKSKLGTVDRPLLTSVDVSGNPWQHDDNLDENIIYLFDLTDKLSVIEDLTIEDSENLKKYMEMKLQGSSFGQLKNLKAKQCDEELNKFLFILLTRSYKLERLTIENCKPLEHVFDLIDPAANEEGNKKFPILRIMTLSGLPRLNRIWNKDPRGIVELGNLVTIEIINCGLKKSPLSTSLLEELVLLAELKIDSCMIEQVVEEENMEMLERSFPSLQNLQLLGLPEFIKFNSGNCNFIFPNLLSLTIEKCPKMNAFTAGFLSNQKPIIEGTSNHDSCPKLQSLKLVGLQPFKEIWQESVCEPIEIEVDSLNNLKYIFPSSMLPGLKELGKLIVRNCNSLSNVFQQTKGKEMKLPMLRELSLICLPKMEHVFDNDSIMDFEKLQIVSVKRCDSLERLLLPSCCPKLKEIEISDCDILKEIFFDAQAKRTDICFPLLESIILKNLPNLSSFSLETFEFPSLQKVRIDGCPEIKTFSKISASTDNFFMDVVRFKILEKLHLRNVGASQNVGGPQSLDPFEVLFHIEEDFPSGAGENGLLPQLQELWLSDLPYPQLWKQEPNIPVFRNLTSLKIIRCGSIEKVFSISLAKHLSALKFLILYGCEKMVRVLHGGEGNGEEVFKKLERLILRDLPSLTYFCEEAVDFGEFPELEMVRVENIPKMKTFVNGSLKTPKLKVVFVTHIAKCWKEDLNNTITYLHKEHADAWGPLKNPPGNSLRDSTDVAESSLQGMKRTTSRFKGAEIEELQ